MSMYGRDGMGGGSVGGGPRPTGGGGSYSGGQRVAVKGSKNTVSTKRAARTNAQIGVRKSAKSNLKKAIKSTKNTSGKTQRQKTDDKRSLKDVKKAVGETNRNALTRTDALMRTPNLRSLNRTTVTRKVLINPTKIKAPKKTTTQIRKNARFN